MQPVFNHKRIREHAICLKEGEGQNALTLLPLCDVHFPYLKKWNQDPDIIEWIEIDPEKKLSEDEIWEIYADASQKAVCFIILFDGQAVGECWLMPADIAELQEIYPSKKVGRIDMMIGEKAYWGRGLGSRIIPMLTDFGCRRMGYDVVLGMMRSDNLRCRKIFEKNAYTLIRDGRLPQAGGEAAGNICVYSSGVSEPND